MALMAVVLAACTPECSPTDPACRTCDPRTMTGPDCSVPFRVSVANQVPNPSSCLVDLTASTIGGEDGAYAMWGDVTARVYDSKIKRFRDVLHPFGDIFDADQIAKGGSQYGKIDLEYFRLYEGEPVTVELRFEYETVDGGTQVVRDGFATLELGCE
jgi:hypothetical protein